jgi:CRP/FNR family cyclic AMP-dependent transcriptional regulator
MNSKASDNLVQAGMLKSEPADQKEFEGLVALGKARLSKTEVENVVSGSGARASPLFRLRVENLAKGRTREMPLIPDAEAFRSSLASLPVASFQSGETVVAAGSTTGRLLILRQGAVEVVKDGTQIARVSEAGAVFGELAVLLDKPHTADVRALERSEFNVADAATLLSENPTALLYVATILARRLDGANTALLEVKRQVETGKPHEIIARSVAHVEEQLSAAGGRHYVASWRVMPT